MPISYTQEEGRDATIKVMDFVQSLGQHDLALTALISAYTTIAAQSPCCIGTCIRTTAAVSAMLTDLASGSVAIKH